jgi:hypothetical protein
MALFSTPKANGITFLAKTLTRHSLVMNFSGKDLSIFSFILRWNVRL